MEVVDNTEYPFEYNELDSDETDELLNYLTREVFTKFIRVGPHGQFFYKEFARIVGDIHNMSLRPTDIFTVSFPRSGTTWSQELVWLLNNNLDYESAKAINLVTRFPFIESTGFLDLNYKEGTSKFKKIVFPLDLVEIHKLPEPRFIKTHMPLSLLPPSLLDTAKVVYVARDPRDVAVSNFFHIKSFKFIEKEKEFKPYWNFFIQNKVFWSPYFAHVKEAWNRRNHPNMIFLFYEELSKDLLAVVHRMAGFFGKEYSDEQYQTLCNHLKFDNFKNNKSVNMKGWEDAGFMKGDFIRKGKSGGWREHFDAEMTQQAERWIADNLRDTDLWFPRLLNEIVYNHYFMILYVYVLKTL